MLGSGHFRRVCPHFTRRFSIFFPPAAGSPMVFLEGFVLIYKGDFSKFSACGGLSHWLLEGVFLFYNSNFQNFRLRRPKILMFRGDSPPQAENFGILDALNVDFTMGKRTVGGENLGKIWPEPQ